MRYSYLSPALLLCAAAIFSYAQPSQAQPLTGTLDVGSNSSNVTTNFTSGTNRYLNAFIGFTDTADNNALDVFNSGTLLTIGTVSIGSSGSSNTVTISNGATMEMLNPNNLMGGTTNANGNTLLVTGTGSSFRRDLLRAPVGFTLGQASSGNSVVISNGGAVQFSTLVMGDQASASNNSVLVTGSASDLSAGLTTAMSLSVGNEGSFNSLTVTNGATLRAAMQVGVGSNSFGNSVLLTGAGTVFIGNDWKVGVRGSGNSMTVSDGAVITNGGGIIGEFAGSTNNTLLVTGAGSTLRTTTRNIGVGLGGEGELTLADGATLDIFNNNINLGVLSNSSGVLNIGAFGGNDSAGPFTALNIRMGESGGFGTVNFNQTNTFVLSSNIQGRGNVNQLGTGSTILLGDNTVSGDITISSGLLAIGDGGTTGRFRPFKQTQQSPEEPVLIANNGTLQFNRSDQIFFEGSISGSGALLKSGAGQLILSTTNSYTGPTTVEAGELIVFASGSIANSTVTVDNGATLTGNGTVGGIVLNLGSTLRVSGTFAAAGTLTVTGDSVWNGGANYNWQIRDTALAAGTGWNLVNATGTLDLSALTVGSEFKINLWSLSSPFVSGPALNFDPNQNYTWTILTAAGGIIGFTGSSQFDINVGPFNGTAGFANGLDGGSFSVAQNGNDLNLVFTAAGGAPIPEPGTWAAAALLVGGAAFLRWRKRKQVA